MRLSLLKILASRSNLRKTGKPIPFSNSHPSIASTASTACLRHANISTETTSGGSQGYIQKVGFLVVLYHERR